MDEVLPTGKGFSDRVYTFLKWVTLIFLPGVAALYYALANIWDFPNPEDVMATLTALATFFGLMIGISQANWKSSGAAYDGNVVVEQNPETGGLVYALQYDGDPAELPGKDQVTFKVTDQNDPFWEGRPEH